MRARRAEPSLTQRLPCCRVFSGRRSASLPRRTMDEDLVEPGGSGVGAQTLQAEVYLETSERPPTPTKSTENEALLPPDTRQAWTSPVERAAIEMSKRRKMTRMKPSVPYVALSIAQLIVGAAIVGVGGAAFATTSNYRPGCFWAGLVVRVNNFVTSVQIHVLHIFQILLLSIYSLTLLCLKLAFHKRTWFRKCKQFLVSS